MKLRTSELTDAALDWAVTKCMGFDHSVTSSEWGMWGWATDWAQGGPIIEREVISLIHPKYDCWTAHCYDKTLDDESYTLDGPTPLIAAMRCYVASRLGDEVDVPEELKC